MADKRKHIDELAKELMQPYQELAPDTKVWSGIKRGMFFYNLTRKIWFWLSLSCVLLCLSLALGGGFSKYFGTAETPRYNQRTNVALAENSLFAQDQQQKRNAENTTGNSAGQTYAHEVETSNQTHSTLTPYGSANTATSENSTINASKATIPGSSLPENNAAENNSSHNIDSNNDNQTKNSGSAESGNSLTGQDKKPNDKTDKSPKEATEKSNAHASEAASEKNTNTENTNEPEASSSIKDEDANSASELTPDPIASKTEQEQKSMLAFARPISVSAELFATYHNSQFTLDELNEQSETLVKIRKDGETSDWSYSAGFGLRLDYSLFFLQAEANYMAYRNTASYKWTEENITKDDFWSFDTLNFSHIDTINAYYDSINATWHYEMDTINQQQIDSTLMISFDTMQHNRHVRTFQELQYWEFPLLIGHSWSIGNWDLEASTGVAVGFFTGSSGKIIINRDYHIVDYDQQNLPFRDARLIWIGRAGAAYKIDDRWSILGRANIRYSLNSVFEDSYDISQKPYSLGVSLGVRFKL